MPKHHNHTPTIFQHAQKRVRYLNRKVTFWGILFFTVVTLVGSSLYHYLELQRGMKSVSAGLSGTVGLGGDFIPQHIMKGAISAGNFKGFWIYDNHKRFIAKRTSEPLENPIIKSSRLMIQSSQLITISNFPLTLNGKKIGTIVAAYHIPLTPIISLLLLVTSVIILMTYFLRRSINDFASSLTNPIIEMTDIINNDKNQFIDNQKSWNLIEINKLYQTFRDYLKKSKDIEEATRSAIVNKKIASIAYKVRHDIKASLYIAENKLGDIPSELSPIKSTFKAVFERICGIVEDIPSFRESEQLNQYEEDELKNYHIASIVSEIINEFSTSKIDKKDISFNTNYHGKSFHSFSLVDIVKFKRAFINLIKNAVDAIPKKGEINISFSNDEDFLFLAIQDNGIGMTKHQLKKIGQMGMTFKGKNGTGLGLSSAIENINSWNGKIEIDSHFGKGTKIKIILPLEEENILFPTKIFIEPHTDVVVADDDPLYLDLYKTKFSNQNFKDHDINFTFFDHTSLVKCWIEKLKKKGRNYLLLSDQNFGPSQDLGLEVSKELGAQEKSILMTSDATKRELIGKSEKEGISLISKSILDNLEINIASS